ncbi:MAG: hypothetical protein XD74_1578 [Actinobacteria bacterium 66_15]|nr:MAG: hypothetical protein XD74_1578 [Actinobacteria bacterium 66_15]
MDVTIDGVMIMKKGLSRTLALTLVTVLVLAFTAPAALAGQGSAVAQNGPAVTAAPNQAGPSYLQDRIEFALQRRATRFDEALRAMEQRQERIMQLAGVVEQAGGDVSQVREMLQECEQLRTQAREQERVAAREFLGVPDAGNRRGAFLNARNQARISVRTMNQARVQLREAAQLLQDIAEDLEVEEDTE